MGKPKKDHASGAKQDPQKPPPEPEDSAGDTNEEVTPTLLGTEDWALIEKANTFLFHIQAYAARAKLHGYDDDEHEHGIQLAMKASGRHRPLSHWIEEGKQSGQPVQFTAEQLRLLQDIDAFENAWFPRIRGILQRAVLGEGFEQFHAAFFKDLKQQPLGPGVIDSVSTLLDRFEALAQSTEAGAKEAFRLGTKRGLTADKIAETRSLIQKARKNMPAAAPKAPISPKQLAKAKEEQLAALDELRRWYNDWAATFRTVFGTRALIRLGLATLKRAAKADGKDKATAGESTEGDDGAAEESPKGGDDGDA